MKSYFKDWMKIIDKPCLVQILNKLEVEYKNKAIYPNQADVFKAFKLCNYNDLKIVILSQDPYPQKNIATGLAFGNTSNTNLFDISPSLQVLRDAIINVDKPHNNIIFDITLEEIAKQGVLLLNSSLTVEENKVGSHIMLWRPFISNLLKNLSLYNSGIIYLLLGKTAQTFKPYINKNSNIILEENHPAYYVRTNTNMPSKVFEVINNLVKNNYGVSIKWYSEY